MTPAKQSAARSGPDHVTPPRAIYVDSTLVAAAEAKVGSLLATDVNERIIKHEATTIHAVTAGTTSLPMASSPCRVQSLLDRLFASLTVNAPPTRALVSVALYAVVTVDLIATRIPK